MNMYTQLFQFLKKSPSAFHAVETMKQRLLQEGAVELLEGQHWDLAPETMYFVTRNDSSLAAFYVPKDPEGFRIMASHSDSPTFKLKENPEMVVDNKYVKLNVEKYGGMILSAWLDRPLSVAGRVLIFDGEKLVSKLVDLDQDLLVIPNVAVHMNRSINDGFKYNVQTDMLPLFGGMECKGKFMSLIAENAQVDEKDILGHDLFLYLRQDGFVFGGEQEFLSAPRLDDLECAFASLEGFLKGSKEKHIAMHCVFDNEEVGSLTKQGASSTFLKDIVTRICEGMNYSEEDRLRMISKSFLVSADNGHAVHPNHPEFCDPSNRPGMNQGVLLKYSANQRYCTDAVSAAMFRQLCQRAEVPCQVFVNRSDMMGGSTLGNLSNAQVSLNAVDIGLPQLAMHSSLETAGVKDLEYLVKVAGELFE